MRKINLTDANDLQSDARRFEPENGTPYESSGRGALDHDEVARLAYDYWFTGGCPSESAEQDWLRAERDLQNLRLAVRESDTETFCK